MTMQDNSKAPKTTDLGNPQNLKAVIITEMQLFMNFIVRSIVNTTECNAVCRNIIEASTDLAAHS